MSQENSKALPTIGFVEATKSGLKNLFNFSGKAGKAEFWWCFLLWLIFLPIVSFIAFMFALVGWGLGLFFTAPDPDSALKVFVATEFIIILIFGAVLLALMHRRFHDTGDNTYLATASVCLFPFAIIGLILCGIFIKVSYEGYLWNGLNEFIDDYKDNWIFLTISLLCFIALFAFIPIFIKTLKCLLKK